MPSGKNELKKLLEKMRSKGQSADCLVGLSGGKDSTFALVSLYREFEVRVEAFTYVHDALTNYALQNAKEVCVALGVRHHLVSLPDGAHLKSFQNFFRAWLKTRQPLAAAMTCVACKHLHILGTELAQQRGIPTMVWASCPLETPPFIPTQPENSDNEKHASMAKLAILLGKTMFAQPQLRRAILQQPGLCTLGCLAFRPDTGWLQMRYPNVKHLHFYRYYPWNGNVMLRKLVSETPWSLPSEIVSDWHSDCTITVLKEYMYQYMYRASYTDAYLSNQIRYGQMTREEGMGALLRSKQFYTNAVPRALTSLGLAELIPECETSCFEINSYSADNKPS